MSVITPSGLQRVSSLASKLGVPRETLLALFEQESGNNPNIWGGAGGKYYGVIQFGPGARKETGLNPKDPSHQTIEGQLPFVERYFSQRGYRPEDYPDAQSRAKALYRTVLVGNPGQSGTDSFGTNSDQAARRMLPGGDLYQRVAKRYGSIQPESPANNIRPTRMAGTALGIGETPPPVNTSVPTAPRPADDPVTDMVASALEARSRRAENSLADAYALIAAAGFGGDGALREAIRQRSASTAVQKELQRGRQSLAAAAFGMEDPKTPTATPAAPQAASAPVQLSPQPGRTMSRGSGPVAIGRVAGPGQDPLPSTGPHLDVRVKLPSGTYVNPETAKSYLQHLHIDGRPLYSQQSGNWTMAYPITSGYGPRNPPTAGASAFHRGIDLAVPAGTPIAWNGPPANVSRQHGYHQLQLEDGTMIKLLHTV